MRLVLYNNHSSVCVGIKQLWAKLLVGNLKDMNVEFREKENRQQSSGKVKYEHKLAASADLMYTCRNQSV